MVGVFTCFKFVASEISFGFRKEITIVISNFSVKRFAAKGSFFETMFFAMLQGGSDFGFSWVQRDIVPRCQLPSCSFEIRTLSNCNPNKHENNHTISREIDFINISGITQE